MTKITVVIESTFAGQAEGFHGITLDNSLPVQGLIDQFCKAKETSPNHNYRLMTKDNVILNNSQPISEIFIEDGEVLKLVLLKDHEDDNLVWKQWLSLAAIGIFVATAGMIASCLLYAKYKDVPNNFAMVIDAGSEDTNLYLYSWVGGQDGTYSDDIKEVQKCTATGAIMDVVPKDMSSYLQPCFDGFKWSVLEQSKKYQEVLFGAVGGIRLLNETSPEHVTEIFSSVKEFLQDSEWNFKDSNVGIISETDEALSNWITINFLEKETNKTDTIGTMSLDDTYTHIAFEVPRMKISPNVEQVTFNDNLIYVFTQSFKCHGAVEALRRYHAALKIEQFGSCLLPGNISSPCEPEGRRYAVPESYFDAFCTNSAELPKNATGWILLGSGDIAECQRVIMRTLDPTSCSELGLGHCIEESPFLPEVFDNKFYAISAFSLIADELGLLPPYTREQMEKKLRLVCNPNRLSEKKNSMHLDDQLCFRGNFLNTLLTHVFEFNSDERWSRIHFTNQISGISLGWSFGYLVNATKELTQVPPIPKVKLVPFSLLTVGFIIFFLLSIAFIIHALKIRKNAVKYQRF